MHSFAIGEPNIEIGPHFFDDDSNPSDKGPTFYCKLFPHFELAFIIFDKWYFIIPRISDFPKLSGQIFGLDFGHVG